MILHINVLLLYWLLRYSKSWHGDLTGKCGMVIMRLLGANMRAWIWFSNAVVDANS